MKIGHMQEFDLEKNPRLIEVSFTRRVSSRGDRTYPKLQAFIVDYEEIINNADIITGNGQIILVREPFYLSIGG